MHHYVIVSESEMVAPKKSGNLQYEMSSFDQWATPVPIIICKDIKLCKGKCMSEADLFSWSRMCGVRGTWMPKSIPQEFCASPDS
jgi:hypothetical protein